MHNSVNRKGVNFKAFDALEGYREALNKTSIDYLKEEKITLSIDQEEYINNVLVKALSNNLFVLIKYYNNGFYKLHSGYIKDINKEITFKDNYNISLSDIVEANII